MADSVKTFLHDLVRVRRHVSGLLSQGLVSFALVMVALLWGAASYVIEGGLKNLKEKGLRVYFHQSRQFCKAEIPAGRLSPRRRRFNLTWLCGMRCSPGVSRVISS